MAVKTPWKTAFLVLCILFFVILLAMIGVMLGWGGGGIGMPRMGAIVRPETVSESVTKVVSVPYGRVAEQSAGCGEYKQIGLLVDKDTVGTDNAPVMLPLFGRKMGNRKDRYEYYTATDKQNMWKVPVEFQHRDCQGDTIGCSEIYDGTDVVVPNYANKTFRANIYKNVMVC